MRSKLDPNCLDHKEVVECILTHHTKRRTKAPTIDCRRRLVTKVIPKVRVFVRVTDFKLTLNRP
jgi:hypothetical protein